MGVVALVRDDEDEIRQRSTGEIGFEFQQGYDAARTASLVQADGVEVNERVVLLDVNVGIAHVARTRHVLEVAFPRPPAGLDLVRQAGGVDEAVRTGAVYPESVAAHQSDVIGQAGMRDGIVLGEQSIFPSPAVVIGHLIVADD